VILAPIPGKAEYRRPAGTLAHELQYGQHLPIRRPKRRWPSYNAQEKRIVEANQGETVFTGDRGIP